LLASRWVHLVAAYKLDSAVNGKGHDQSRMRQRSSRALTSQDVGLNFGVREDLLSESRNLTQTFSMSGYINRKYANHVVGSCRMKWMTGDQEIDKIYSDAWQAWMPMADRSVGVITSKR
jgi:hypothetical protein